MNDRLSGNFKQSLRWREDVNGLNNYFLDGNLTLQALQWLNLAAAYRHIWAKLGDDWVEERRPHADVTVKVNWGKVSFSDRNRFEWRHVEEKEEEVRYRNKLTALWRNGYTSHQFRPYVAGEAFLNEGNTDLFNGNRYRVTIGIRGDPEDEIRHVIKNARPRRFKADLFFTFESTRTDNAWIDSYIVGTKLGVFF